MLLRKINVYFFIDRNVFKATTKTWTQTLDQGPEPDPERPRPRKTWTLKNLNPEKPGP